MAGKAHAAFLQVHHGDIQYIGDFLGAGVLAALEEQRRKLHSMGYLRSDGWFYYEHRRIADLLKLSKTHTVAARIERLRNLGLLETKPMRDQRGRRLVHYKLDDDAILEARQEGSANAYGIDQHIVEAENPIDSAVSREPLAGSLNTRQTATRTAVRRQPALPANGSRYSSNKEGINKKLEGTNVPYAGQGPKRGGKLSKLSRPASKPKRSANTNPHARQEARLAVQEEEARRIPRKYQPVFDAFADVAVRHKPGTKTVERAVKRLRDVTSGRLFRGIEGYEGLCRKITVDEIVKAIKRFDKFRNSAAYYPTNKKPLQSLGLADFLYNDYAVNGTASWFARCMAERPKLATDRDPELSASVQRQWREAKGTDMDYETAVRVAGKVLGMWRTGSPWYKRRGIANKKQLAGAIMLAMEDRHGSDWGVGHLLGQAAEHTLKQRLERIAS